MKRNQPRAFWIAFEHLHVNGMALFPFVLIKDAKLLQDEVFKNHERIHLRQQIEIGIIPFYLLYLTMYFINRLKGQRHYQAYRNILFEQEAFSHERDFIYLKSRKWCAWARN